MADPRSITIAAHAPATAHHIDTGATVFPYAIDAHSAVSRFPGEWSFTPWTGERRDRALAARKERYEADVVRAREFNQPVPQPLPADPLPPTPEEQAAIDAHTQAQAEAAKRLEEFDRKEAERAKVEQQVAADRALVAQPPPQPDPNIRRPFGRKGEPTEAERAMMAKRAAKETDEQRLVREKRERDEQAAARDRIAAENAGLNG